MQGGEGCREGGRRLGVTQGEKRTAQQGCEGASWCVCVVGGGEGGADVSVPCTKVSSPPSKPLCLTPFRPPLPPSRLCPESHKGGNLMESAQLDLEKNIPCW